MKRLPILHAWLGLLLSAGAARAQYELKSGNFNSTWIGGPPTASNLPATPGQYSSVGQVAGASGPLNTVPAVTDGYPSNAAKTLMLQSSSIGGIVASGVPRYAMGDWLLPPLTQHDGSTPAPAGYWRLRPVLPGESIPGLGELIPDGTVTVVSAQTTSPTVEVSAVVPELVPGALLLGEPIVKVTGTTVTLAANARSAITSATPLPVLPATSFYYSPHADKAFAHQPGRVTVTWVTREQQAGSYRTVTETFAVASGTTLPVRTIFWTEGSFDGPRVAVNDSRITTVNPAFSSLVPKGVAEEVSIPGYTPTSPNLTTLSFQKINGTGSLRAYNVEGRVLVEYLGNLRAGIDVYEQVGLEVVDIKRVSPVNYPAVHLGSEITASSGDAALIPSPVFRGAQDGLSYYGTSLRPDNTQAYFAERATSETNDPDNGEPRSPSEAYNKVVFYWLERGAYSIQWPKFQDRYWLRWSPHLTDYAHYTVDTAGSTTATGISFDNGALPEIVYQDDAAQNEARLDLDSQRLYVSLAGSADLRNRSLLKFTSGGGAWYVNLYTQAEIRQTVRAVHSPPPGLFMRTFDTQFGGSLLNPIGNLFDAVPSGESVHTGTINFIGNFDLPGLTSPDTFSVLWQGWFHAASAGAYTFGTESDDGSVIYLDLNNDGDFADSGEFIVNNNGDHGLQSVTGTVTLPAGFVRIAIAFYENGGGEVMRARWGSGASLPFASLTVLDAGSGPFFTSVETSLLELASTAGLETGMVVTGPGISGSATITSIRDSRHIELSQSLPPGARNLTFTVQSDSAAPINTTATVGTRLTPPAGHEVAGYISGGTGYFPAGYLNPHTVGVAAANDGAIIPVNALPGNDTLSVRWFRRVSAPTAAFHDLYVPGKVGRYTVSFPVTTAPEIIIAQGVGTDDLPPAESTGFVYYQNNSAQPGFNPNEEHAFMLGGRTYALRDDLNTSATSQPCVLMAYTDPADGRPAMHAYRVLRSNAQWNFNYVSTAGTLLIKPYPLPLMPLPLEGEGTAMRSRDIETTKTDYPANSAVSSQDAYRQFTFQDRKGFTWIHRGPHTQKLLTAANYGNGIQVSDVYSIVLNAIATQTPFTVSNAILGGDPAPNLAKRLTLSYRTEDGLVTETVNEGGAYTPVPDPKITMQLYYKSRPGFFAPGLNELPPDTILPFLRQPARSGTALNLAQTENGQPDEPLPIIYRPAWPEQPAELRVAETLTLPKFGLPQVRGQTSAEIYYQQSIGKITAAPSVTLHDPTREKAIALNDSAVGLTGIPAAIATTNYRGRIYFQKLPPHLQQRVYVDPLRGAKGTLIFTGSFHDVPAGEDYLDLNLFSAADQTAIRDLIPASDADRSKWDTAISMLLTSVETFQENPARLGTWIPDNAQTQIVGPSELAVVSSAETAVDSYALTATGKGRGFVTMVFGNGRAFTPEGDPVQVKVFRVAPQLYTGDLKVVQSSNPLDEQVTLRHSGDFAGKPENYEFEWRWTTGAASAPAVYTVAMQTRIGSPTAAGTRQWRIISDPESMTGSAADYATATPLPLPRSVNVRPASYSGDEKAAALPAVVLKSEPGVDFATGVPGDIFFSADMGSLDGFVLYVNGTPAVAHNAPSPPFSPANAAADLSPAGLPLQFRVPSGFFTAGPNTIEVAVYSDADANYSSTLNFRLEAATETDAVLTPSTVWQTASDPAQRNTNMALVGGSPLNPFGGSTFVLNDRWFTMRYRPKAGTGNVLGTQWSRWMPPQFVEGWVKRVLAAINPFEQRVKDLFNNAINTDVSVLTQAGKRWEGDIALTMGNINDVGLIEIYETVLNRAKAMSIDANTNDPDSNNALLLAAGYLNDLYTLVGNEAFADAANPTISLDGDDGATQVNTSRFSFEGQVSTSLDEELALLRGRDDFVSPGTGIAPAYNRLYWNYTRGINSGEAIYALNYNIREKAGSDTANGVIDEADAQRMFPQGHGDAYGHYLTAISGYYQLLTNPNFSWTPRAEAVTVLGQPVTVDFFDERKFAAAAGRIAASAEQIIALTWRQNYNDEPSSGWEHFHDDQPANPQTGITRRQGMDEWVSRAAQGTFYHWAVANAMLPVEDTVHTGIQKIDRSTVPEISRLATLAAGFQTTVDNASAHLNPLGLSPGAIAFDISPSLLNGEILYGTGAWHYEQIAARAVTAISNASGAFNQAASMTGMLRNQEITADEFNTAIFEEERSYTNELIDIYGRPYSGDVGAGKLYAQDYTGPDLRHWYIVDRPNNFVDTAAPVVFRFLEPVEEADKFPQTLSTGSLPDVWTTFSRLTETTVLVQPSQFVQYNDVWKPGGLGSRPVTGELQDALTEAQLTLLEFNEARSKYDQNLASMRQKVAEFTALVDLHRRTMSETRRTQNLILGLNGLILALNTTADSLELAAGVVDGLGDTLAEFFPRIAGLANDVTSGARGTSKLTGGQIANILKGIAIAARAGASGTEIGILNEEQNLSNLLTELGFTFEEKQFVWEFKNAYRDLVSDFNGIMQIHIEHLRAVQNVANVLSRGDRVLAARELFRQRAASVIQGYRTRDVTFRLFRNEALEQYRSLFDLASRYTYLAAKSYDYETGLLGTAAGQEVFGKIVASRSLGEIRDGKPLLVTSALGDGGLSSTMARLNADYSVAEGRLGIHAPDLNGTVFSLRGELYRIMQDDSLTSDEEAWRQTLEQRMVSNVMADADVAKHCRNIRKADGSPVPGIIIPFRTTIQHGQNFFGLDLAGGDHAFTASNFATKILSVGISLPGYVGMDAYAAGEMNAGAPASGAALALSATPYVYLIPCGVDYMLAPPLGDTNQLRSWKVEDQALPLPFNLGENDFNSTQFFNANGTLSEQPWITRKHQAFRPVNDPAFFYGAVPTEFTSTRLIGRSVWNSQWKIVIPAYTLLANEQEGLNRFAASVQDVQLFLRTYSHSGN